MEGTGVRVNYIQGVEIVQLYDRSILAGVLDRREGEETIGCGNNLVTNSGWEVDLPTRITNECGNPFYLYLQPFAFKFLTHLTFPKFSFAARLKYDAFFHFSFSFPLR
jgi:hypothetical protein